MDPIDVMKHRVGTEAAALARSGMVVGLGSGSTAAVMIAALGDRIRSGQLSDVVGVPTSFQAEVLAQDEGIPLQPLNSVDVIDLAIDGADEVDPSRNLIKGGGACHTREKLVASRAERLVIVVDHSKLVERLGSTMPIPVEVLPEAYLQVMGVLRRIGGDPVLRMAVRKAGPVVTDQGNLVLDATFDGISDPGRLEAEINNIPGVLDNGLFVSLADQILVGHVADDGTVGVQRIG